MTTQILIAGFGGQGVLFAGKFIAYKGLLENKMEAYNRDVFHSVTADESKVYAKFVNAENFEKKGLLKKALANYDLILHSYPQAISAHISKGLIFEYKRMYMLSLDSYRLALQINPNDDFTLERVREISHKIIYEGKQGFYLGCNVSQQRLIDMARLEMQYGTISKAKLLFRQTEQYGVLVPYARAIIKYINITNNKLIVSQESIKHKWIIESKVQIQEDFEDVSIFLGCNKDQARLIDLALQGTDLDNIEEA